MIDDSQVRARNATKLTERYPLVPLQDIRIIERPRQGSEDRQLFYNPRNLDNIDPDTMDSLRESIMKDGLHSPPIVRVTTIDGERDSAIERIELIAGERRLRSIMLLYADNDLVKDFDGEMRHAREVFENVPCKVLYNTSDEESLRHAWIENHEHQALSLKDQIDLIERLSRRGYTQEEIAKLLGTHPSWVSQTQSFRSELPPIAFQKLLDGTLSRSVAVQLLQYHAGDRQSVVDAAIEDEEIESAAKCEELDAAIADIERLEELELDKAEQASNTRELEAAKQRASRAAKKADTLVEKKLRVQSQSGVIRQGNVRRGAAKNKIRTKKAKTLDKQQIEQFYVDLTDVWIRNNKVDPTTGKTMSRDILLVMRYTAEAIAAGEQDPAVVYRQIEEAKLHLSEEDGDEAAID